MKTRLVLITILLSLTGMVGCDIHKPGVSDSSYTSVNFPHKPMPTSCISCHSTKKPLDMQGLSIGTQPDIFLHNSTYNGDQDCVLCHTQNPQSVGVDWKTGVFNHKTAQNTDVTTCRECHSGNVPLTPIGPQLFDHKIDGKGECVLCHKNVGADWSMISFSHTPTPFTCISCHNSDRPNPTAYFPANPAFAQKSLFTHSAQYNGTSDCLSCHSQNVSNIGVSWQGGVFDHKTNLGTSVTSCRECHLGNTPSGPVGTSLFDHTNMGTNECNICHTNNVGINWKNALVPHTPTPTSCSNCHNSERPNTATYIPSNSALPTHSLFVHSATYNGTSDCLLCHTQTPQNIGIMWQGGVFDHKTNAGLTVSNCRECHLGNMPTTTVGTSNFDHATIGTNECFNCHKNVGGDWATVHFSHTPTPTSCNSCHSSTLPNPTTFYPSNPAQPSIDLFAHNNSYNGTADCVTCHIQTPANVGVNWLGAFYNHKTNTGSTVSQCRDCHLGNMPSTLVGTSSFDHKTIGTSECVTCHTNVGNNWTSVTFSHTPTPTSCVNCHSSTRPNSTTYIPSDATKPTLDLFVHISAYNGAADCVTCHTKIPANVGVQWTGAYYNHKTDTGTTVNTCINCHTGSRPTSHTVAAGMTGDCSSCHTHAGVDWLSPAPVTVVMQPPTAVTRLLAITIKHPTVQTGMTCSTCHASYNTTGSIKGFDHTEGLILASNNTAVSNSCYYCHFSPNQVISSTVVNNTSKIYSAGKMVLRTNSHHGNTLANSTSCLSCHTATAPPSWSSGTSNWTTTGKWNGG